jgi:hypothetical protein
MLGDWSSIGSLPYQIIRFHDRAAFELYTDDVIEDVRAFVDNCDAPCVDTSEEHALREENVSNHIKRISKMNRKWKKVMELYRHVASVHSSPSKPMPPPDGPLATELIKTMPCCGQNGGQCRKAEDLGFSEDEDDWDPDDKSGSKTRKDTPSKCFDRLELVTVTNHE